MGDTKFSTFSFYGQNPLSVTIHWKVVEQYLYCLFFNFTQFVILENLISLGLGTFRSERFKNNSIM